MVKNQTYVLDTLDAADEDACAADFGSRHHFAAGTAVLVRRGTCLFLTKVQACAAAGAALVVVYNDAGDGLVHMVGAGTASIPSLFVGATDGAVLRARVAAAAAVPGGPRVTVAPQYELGPHAVAPDVVAPFSSRGPTVDMDLAPDVAAPGVGVVAAGGAAGVDARLGYCRASGTSVAAPHAAGVAALVRQAHPRYGGAELRCALMNTAVFATVVRRDGTPAQPLDVGAGRVDAARAVAPTLRVTPPALSFALVAHTRVHTLTLTVAALGPRTRTVHVAAVRHTGNGTVRSVPHALAAVTPDVLNLAPGDDDDAPGTPATVSVTIGTNQGSLVPGVDVQLYIIFSERPIVGNSTSSSSLDEEGEDVPISQEDILASVPLWARPVCDADERASVALLSFDADDAAVPLYEAAARALGVAHRTYRYAETAGAVPARVVGQCARAVVAFAGPSTGTGALLDANSALRQTLHAGTPVALAGRGVTAGFGLADTAATAPGTALADEFGARFESAPATVARLAPSALTPPGIPALAPIALRAGVRVRPLTRGDADQTVLLADARGAVAAHAVRSRPAPGAPAPLYNSVAAYAAVGLDDVADAPGRAALLRTLLRHLTARPVACDTALLEFADPRATLRLVCAIPINVVAIGWGDGHETHYSLFLFLLLFTLVLFFFFFLTAPFWFSGALEIQTKEFAHVYTRNGTFTPDVIATTRDGLTYALNTSTLQVHVAAAASAATTCAPAALAVVAWALLALLVTATTVL